MGFNDGTTLAQQFTAKIQANKGRKKKKKPSIYKLSLVKIIQVTMAASLNLINKTKQIACITKPPGLLPKLPTMPRTHHYTILHCSNIKALLYAVDEFYRATPRECHHVGKENTHDWIMDHH